MSADNWARCKFCEDAYELARDKRINSVAAQYGRIPAADFLGKMDAAKADPDPLPNFHTLREDYGIGVDGGEFSVEYSGSCSKCGFSFAFKHSSEVEPPKPKANPAIRKLSCDYDTRRNPKTNRSCVLCQKDLTGPPKRLIHIINGGGQILHSADELLYTPDSGDMFFHEIGNDCAKKIGMEWSHAPQTKEPSK